MRPTGADLDGSGATLSSSLLRDPLLLFFAEEEDSLYVPRRSEEEAASSSGPNSNAEWKESWKDPAVDSDLCAEGVYVFEGIESGGE